MILSSYCFEFNLPPPTTFIENLKIKTIAAKEKFKKQIQEFILHSIREGFDQFYVPHFNYVSGRKDEEYWSHTNTSLIERESLIEIGIEMKNNGYYFGCSTTIQYCSRAINIGQYSCVIRVIEHIDQYKKCPYFNIREGIEMEDREEPREYIRGEKRKPILYCPVHADCLR
jgi:hypothetical protein